MSSISCRSPVRRFVVDTIQVRHDLCRHPLLWAQARVITHICLAEVGSLACVIGPIYPGSTISLLKITPPPRACFRFLSRYREKERESAKYERLVSRVIEGSVPLRLPPLRCRPGSRPGSRRPRPSRSRLPGGTAPAALPACIRPPRRQLRAHLVRARRQGDGAALRHRTIPCGLAMVRYRARRPRRGVRPRPTVHPTDTRMTTAAPGRRALAAPRRGPAR